MLLLRGLRFPERRVILSTAMRDRDSTLYWEQFWVSIGFVLKGR